VTSHAGVMIIFALFVSVVFAALMRDEPKDQVRLAARIFGGMVGGGILAAWLLYPLPF
jgi:hypothetical protein